MAEGRYKSVIQRSAIVVYGAAMLQGFAFTLVPSLATLFSAAPYNIGASAFGALFIPLTLGAILAALLTPTLARKRGMVGVLGIGIAANIFGLVALVASVAVRGNGAYLLLLVDTSALGIGFGFNFSAVNELASQLSARATRDVTFANVLTGLGTSLTPLFIGAFVARGIWPLWPVVLALAFAAVLVLSVGWRAATPAPVVRANAKLPRALLLFGGAALLYAFCEGAFSSWATTFAQVDRSFSLATGEAALAAFWLALTLTRLALALSSRYISARIAFAAFPFAIAAAFLALPLWRTPMLLVAGFALAGIACSIVFPYAMSLAFAAMPSDEDRVAGVLVGALMTGEGFGTFAIGLLRSDAGVTLATIYRVAALVAFALAIVAILALKSSPPSAVKASA
uniref:Putative Major facilitator superfamily MFS_1 n=1 Tax=mine drainage metagenome TaxID=410659 RepID=E6Q367_9ZZZZ